VNVLATLGAYAAATAAIVVAVIAWRSNRRLVAAQTRKADSEAGEVDERRLRELRREVDDERAKREGLAAEFDAYQRYAEERMARQERHIAVLERALRDNGIAVPAYEGGI
jgi:uncharacterized protein YlxW (UPF0749 family)